MIKITIMKTSHKLTLELYFPLVLMVLALSCSKGPTPEKPRLVDINDTSQYFKRSIEFTTSVETKAFASSDKFFSTQLKQTIDGSKIAEIYSQLESEVGNLKQFGNVFHLFYQKFNIIFIETIFEEKTLFTQLVFNKKNEVVGFYIKPKLP